jgi:uncharacterized damage-inducible protein DinB
MDIADFRSLFSYDSWANREVLKSIAAAPMAPARALKLVAHILGAEEIWYARIRGVSPVLAVWPDLDKEKSQQHQHRLREAWSNYLAQIEAGQLSRSVSYKNSKGESWTSQISDILMHVVMHSAYHRGQIASDIRAAGYTPAYTDFIHGIRSGLVE